MYLFGHQVVCYNYSDKPTYYKWYIFRLPKKLGEFLWNTRTPKFLHRCKFNGAIKNQCSICGRYKS